MRSNCGVLRQQGTSSSRHFVDLNEGYWMGPAARALSNLLLGRSTAFAYDITLSPRAIDASKSLIAAVHGLWLPCTANTYGGSKMTNRTYIARRLEIVGSVLYSIFGPGGTAYEPGGPTSGQVP